MSYTINDLKRVQAHLKDCEQELAIATGRKKELVKRLKALGFNSPKEAEEWLNNSSRKIDKLENQIKTRLEAVKSSAEPYAQ